MRLSLLSAALWWAAFTIIPFRAAAQPRRPSHVVPEPGGLLQRSFGQLWHDAAASCARYPMTLTFLLAYLFYNDGIQTVIYAAVDVRLQAARLRHSRC